MYLYFFLQDMVEFMVNVVVFEIQKWELVVVKVGGLLDYDVELDIYRIVGKVILYIVCGSDLYEMGLQFYEFQN